MKLDSSPQSDRLSMSSASGATEPIPKKSLQIRTDKPRPHACSICTRGFARLEHLKRHERSHTNEKPFQCAACGRCFARRDLVLRHQQKLHQHIFQVARRGSLPASLSQSIDPSAASSISNDNIIVLNNNTKAKAPLLSDRSERLSSSNYHQSNSPSSSNSNDSPQDSSQIPNSRTSDLDYPSFQQNASLNGNMPSPHTNSSTNTPSFQAKNSGVSSMMGDPDLQIAPSNFIQQPSPLTGNSPDTKDKKASALEGLEHTFDSRFSSNFQDFNKIRKSQAPNQRYASFSAVSGLSYTNLQDALTIQKSHIDLGLPPSAYSHDKGLIRGDSILDFGNLDLDWYSMDFGTSAKETPYQTLDPMDQNQKQGNKSQSRIKMVQPDAQLPDNMHPDYFSNHIMTTHQFSDPNHPHHIKGTTPLALDFAPNDTHGFGEEEPVSVGTGFAQLAGDLSLFGEKPASRTGSPNEVVAPRPKRSRTSSKQPKQRNSPESNDSKRAKIGFVNEVEDLDWLEQIKGIPVLNKFPSASNVTGFLGMPYIAKEAQAQSDEVFSLFKVRQEDIVRQRSELDNAALMGTSNSSEKSANASVRGQSRVQFTIGESKDFITDELRSKIIEVSDLNDEQFPNLEDLNDYMNLYEKEFNAYFPFIHTPTLRNPMIDNFENIPLILSMCSIGALYSYHDSNTLLLFNLSKFHIHNFFENEVTVDKLQFKKVPIMAHQCLVLHMFISMFLNEPNMVEITSRQMNSMVGLIKSTNFHRPLEEFLVPPPKFTSQNDTEIIQNNYDYFIMTQTRIRTIQTFYQMEIMRSLLLGCPVPMSGMEIACGTHCNDERLWESGNSTHWYNCVKHLDNTSLVELSNNEQMNTLRAKMEAGTTDSARMTYKNSAALLMYVHEQISHELQACKDPSNGYKWRTEHRPKLSALLKTWEDDYLRNGGRSFVRDMNFPNSDFTADLKLILPFFYLAKIRICIDFTPVTERVLHKDWKAMGDALQLLECDVEALKEASAYAVEILKLWTENIHDLQNAKLVSVRTPVFFITAVFIAVMIMSKTLMVLESSKHLSVADMALWSTLENVLKTIETTLNPRENSSYSEFLRKQCRGIFDFAWSEECKRNIQTVISKLSEGSLQAEDLRTCKLSTQALGLGVRILADAPLWPLAMSFAEALKTMALTARS